LEGLETGDGLLAFSLLPLFSTEETGRKDLQSNLQARDMEVEQFKDFLGSRGFKSTREREIILKELESRKDHFNAEKLYSVLNRKGTKVSRPTIYRTLKLLEQFHLIERLDIKKNCFYYEPTHQKNHGHLICKQCGRITDFHCESLESLKSEAAKGKDFKSDNISVHVFGICGNCQKISKIES
jgi:Fur family ferric uptake transcriptional regulator